MSTNLDFIAIGDLVIDAFIRLKKENAHVVKNPTTGIDELCMTFGDKIPFEFAEEIPAVGNSANAAVSAARLGLTSALVSNLGSDQHGKECIDRLKEEHVVTRFITSYPGLVTNYHYVLWYEQDRTILIKHEKFPYTLPDIATPKWLYVSSLGENSLDFHTEIGNYLESHPDIKLVFQPGTYQIKFGKDALKKIYAHTEIFFCNLEEAEKILGLPNNDKNRDPKALLQSIKALGPKLPVITDGPHGAYALETDASGAEKVVFMPIYPDPKPPYERTGAGDAFASTFTVAIALGKTIEEALKWASINSMSVCQDVGAQKGLLSATEIEKYLTAAPQDWNAKTI